MVLHGDTYIYNITHAYTHPHNLNQLIDVLKCVLCENNDYLSTHIDYDMLIKNIYQ